MWKGNICLKKLTKRALKEVCIGLYLDNETQSIPDEFNPLSEESEW